MVIPKKSQVDNQHKVFTERVKFYKTKNVLKSDLIPSSLSVPVYKRMFQDLMIQGCVSQPVAVR